MAFCKMVYVENNFSLKCGGHLGFGGRSEYQSHFEGHKSIPCPPKHTFEHLNHAYVFDINDSRDLSSCMTGSDIR